MASPLSSFSPPKFSPIPPPSFRMDFGSHLNSKSLSDPQDFFDARSSFLVSPSQQRLSECRIPSVIASFHSPWLRPTQYFDAF